MNTRRSFLKKLLAVSSAWGVPSAWFLAVLDRALAQGRRIVLPKETKREDLLQKNPAELDSRHLELTPLRDFGTMGMTDHTVDLDEWALHVDGHVNSPFKLSYREVGTLPHIERNVLLICPGFFANHGRWKGISIGDLLKRAALKKGATHVTVRGPESSHEKADRFSLEEVRYDKIFLADRVNGEPLPRRHGYPLRLVAEDHYGYDWVKYVYRLTAEKVGRSGEKSFP